MSNTVITYTTFNAESQILRYPQDLKFRVYYLEAPLSILGERIGIDFVDNLLSINGYHTGVGFQSTDKSRPYQFTFDMSVAAGFTLNALLPTIVTDPQGNQDLVWNNQQQITLGSFIDKFYWERSTYICTITSSQLVMLQEWILDTWIPRNPIYSLFSGIAATNTADIFNPIFRPSICDTFCYSMFNYIASTDGGNQVDPVNTGTGLGVCIEYVTLPNVSISAFVQETSPFTPVDFETNRTEIIAFYTEFEAEISQIVDLEQTIQELIAELETAPPEERPALIRQIVQELFTLIQLASTVYSNFDVAYYYGYGIGDNIDNPQYWRIDNPELFLTYINSNLRDSYRGLTATGSTVIDSYSDELNCLCNCTHDCPVCPDVPVEPVVVESTSSSWWIVFIIIGIVLFIFIILLLFFLV